MRRAPLFVLLLMSIAVLAACGGDDDDTSSTGDADTGTPATADDLESGPWQLLSYATNAAGDLTAASERQPGTAEFDGEVVSGSTGCNRYSAGYDLCEDGTITISSPQATLIACQGRVGEQEQYMLAGFDIAAQAVIDDGELLLLDAGGVPVLLFSPESESSASSVPSETSGG
jgi:heat shock protein HslJ